MARIRRQTLVLVYCACAGSLVAQTTQGLIAGRVIDLGRRLGLPAAILCENLANHAIVSAATSQDGFYALPLLPPGAYRIDATSPGYQRAERYDLELPVAGFLEQDFSLEPAGDIWASANPYRSILPGSSQIPGSGFSVTAYGPDVASSQTSIQPVYSRESGTKGELQATVSAVFSQSLLEHLPLASRDAFALLALIPGSSAYTSTSRGLGLTVSGQRPSASNFMIDGIESNNYVTTGPAVPIPPEAIQEYRVSIANFSAEFGRTSGYLANAVTRSGGAAFHALVYSYLRNQHANANGFSQNANGYTRPYEHETEDGVAVSGPIRRGLFFSLTADYDRYSSELDPENLKLPTANLRLSAPAGSIARAILDLFPPPAPSDSGALLVTTQLRPPTVNERWSAIPRLDWIHPGGHHFTLRSLNALQRRPDFDWTPYPGFTTPLTDLTAAPAFSWTWNLTPQTTTELRAGYSWDNLGFDRRNPTIPVLSSKDGAILPSSPLVYSYRDRSRSIELTGNFTRLLGRHVLQAGAEFLQRSLGGYLAPLTSGTYSFPSASAFAQGTYLSYFTLGDLNPSQFVPLDFRRAYAYRQFSAYAQDSFRIARHLMLEIGARYENFGAPRNTGPVKDSLILLGDSPDAATAVAHATYEPAPAGAQRLFATDNLDFAGRFGVSWSARDNGSLLLHAGFGTFFDKPFDNLWLTLSNNGVAGWTANAGSQLATLGPPPQLFPGSIGFPLPTVFQRNLRNGRVNESFLGAEYRLSRSWKLDAHGQSSLGRLLITNDQINRSYPPAFILNKALPPLNYRAAQGSSNFLGLVTSVRYANSRVEAQAAFTWSHAIDIQSEPLTGNFFNLDSFSAAPNQAGIATAAFTGEFQPGGDRANSDFDQRRNLVILATWRLPAPPPRSWSAVLLRDWRASSVAALRSGFPFSVIAPFPNVLAFSAKPLSYYINNTANLIDPSHIWETGGAAPNGSESLLNAKAFAAPVAGVRGNLGRNALTGPGLYNLDLSLSRSILVPKTAEKLRLILRADAYNALNHANLGNPCGLFQQTCGASVPFGAAVYGRLDANPGYPSATPINEGPRKLQFMLRVMF